MTDTFMKKERLEKERSSSFVVGLKMSAYKKELPVRAEVLSDQLPENLNSSLHLQRETGSSHSVSEKPLLAAETGHKGHGGSKRTRSWREVRQSAKSAAIFALIMLLFASPFKVFTAIKDFRLIKLKGQVMGVSESAVTDMVAAGSAVSQMSWQAAANDFTEAEKKFRDANKMLGEVQGSLIALASVMPNKTLNLAGHSREIIEAGSEASLLGKELALAAEAIAANYSASSTADNGPGGQSQLASGLGHFELALEHASNISRLIKDIDPESLPEKYQATFASIKSKTEDMEGLLSELDGICRVLFEFFGGSGYKRYLFVFQNNAEMRGRGGFIGSFALVDFSNGKIKKIETPGGGSYDTEAGMKEYIAAPDPLKLLKPRWFFWDANWWPDWPTSAEKLAWFYQHSGGASVDGVITLTPTCFEKILAVLGPIELGEPYNVAISADNFYGTVQRFSEQKEDVTNTPKKIIGDMIEEIKKQAPARMNKGMMVELVKVLESSFGERQAMIYSKDESVQEKIREYGWDGGIKDAPRDYLMIVNTNLGGGKSDRMVKEQVDQKVSLDKDGFYVSTLKVTRSHTGFKGQEWSGVRNVDWMRFYVPAGSVLLEAGGFEAPPDDLFEESEPDWEKDPLIAAADVDTTFDQSSGTRIYQEFGKTVFANWSQVDPGESVVLIVKYRLPFKLQMENPVRNGTWDKIVGLIAGPTRPVYPYSLLLQKQPGAKEISLHFTFDPGQDYKPVWTSPSGFAKGVNGYEIDRESPDDIRIGLLLAK